MQPRFYRSFIVKNSSRKRRRVWVAVMYAGLIAWTVCSAYLWKFAVSRLNVPWSPWSLMALDLASVLAWSIGTIAVSGTVAYTLSGSLVFRVATEPEERKPDERQRATHHRAGYLAWIFTVCLIGMTYIYWMVVEVAGLSLPVPRTEVLVWVFGGVAIFVGTLPSAIIAWNEPDAEE